MKNRIDLRDQRLVNVHGGTASHSEGQEVSPIGERDFDGMTAGDWLHVAWGATKHFARLFWRELKSSAGGR